MTGVNIQLGTVTMADVADLRRFDAALLICDWPARLPDTLAVLDAAGVRVGIWRWTEDPRGWLGWPDFYRARCPWALFANEPDLPAESWPAWYEAACAAWRHAGGKLVEPALSDEGRYGPLGMARVEQALAVATGHGYDVLSAHCYAGDVHNLTAVRARALGRPVFVSEYAHQHHQQDVLQELADRGVKEPTFLFVYRWKPPGNVAGYELAGVGLVPANSLANSRMPPGTPAYPGGTPQIAPASPAGKAPIVTAINEYCSELGPDGLGHARCGLACMVSVEMAYGNAYDPYQRLLQLQAKAPWVDPQGMTSDQMIALARSLGYQAETWVTWPDALAALDAGRKVLCLLDNWYIRPRMYPAGGAWDALHWVRLVGLLAGGKYAQLMDPLVYVPGEYPVPFQGPSIVDAASLHPAIAATRYDDGTPIPEAGVLIWK